MSYILEYLWDDGQRSQHTTRKVKSKEEGLELAEQIEEQYVYVSWILYEKNVIAQSNNFIT